MADVLIVGAGPVGLTLACELARHGASCRIVDRLPHPSPYCRAIGVTPRTLEVWEDMGVARAMIDGGIWIDGMRSIIDGRPGTDERPAYPDLPYAHLGVPQNETERVLGQHLAGFGIRVERGVAFTSLVERDTCVSVHLESMDGTAEDQTFSYVVGCDGAHSAVRRALGIGFDGEALPMTFMLGDVRVAWDLPRGMALRALRLRPNTAPDLFIAIPLPEPGRYRVSMLAPSALEAGRGTEHGIQSEARGPSLDDIQAVADDVVPGQPRLSDLRWSSVFRISMRLAQRYRHGRGFIAGDAAHIHPPTGGQGMNTGIQDAYNLAWKLALVLQGAAPHSLLDSYEAERRPVGADVVARTRAATQQYGREGGGQQDRLADTQILVSYKGTPWVRDDVGDRGGLAPAGGDRAPDAVGLMRHGVGYPHRLFDILRGTEHVLVAHVTASEPKEELAELSASALALRVRFGPRLRVVAVTTDAVPAQPPGIALFFDRDGAFSRSYGTQTTSVLVRPDGYIGWRGRSWRDAGLSAYLDAVLQPAGPASKPRPGMPNR